METRSESKLSNELLGWIVEDSFDRGEGLRSSHINYKVSSLNQIISTPPCKVVLSSTNIANEVNKKARVDALSTLTVSESIYHEEIVCLT